MQQIPIKQATALAMHVYTVLKPVTDRIHIAGSIRRQKQWVKDIEIVCTPKKEFIATDLFGGGETHTAKLFTETVASLAGSIVKGNTDGRYMQVILKEGITMDLFMPVEKDYYRQYAIRTGSSQYVNLYIAHTWTKLGWCGTKNMGLRRQSDCNVRQTPDGKNEWTCINPNGQLPPVWESEEDFFAWLGLSYLHPRLREVEQNIKL